jgi:hypothetical protein
MARVAEPKKRLHHWLLACAVILLVCGLLASIAVIGRQGTIAGRFRRPRPGMSEAEVVAILGHPHKVSPGIRIKTISLDTYFWVEGPATVLVTFSSPPSHPESRRAEAGRMALYVKRYPTFWHLRRWAEKAWMAIHGPRL